MRPSGLLTIERGRRRWTLNPADIPAHFTDQQGAAFEKGFTARTYEESADRNPYQRRGMQQAWFAGYDYARRQA
jgi:ribosome modulation factor